MRRWIRRILLTCSIALMVASAALWYRSHYAFDILQMDVVALFNTRDRIRVVVLPDEMSRWWFGSEAPSFPFQAHTIRLMSYMNLGVVYPHWTLLVVGAGYPVFLLLRCCKKKKDIGFPVVAKSLAANEQQS